jgi:hypothetical protein
MIKEKDWFKVRGYLHFSNKLSIDYRDKVLKYVSNSEKICRHSFLPLIYKEIKHRRYKLSSFGSEKRRSHKKLENNRFVSNAKIRPILYSSHLDSQIYSYYTNKILKPRYENYLDKNPILAESITAYRQIDHPNGLRFKNNVSFAKDVFDEIKERENCVALVFDIENFFPSLSHKLLKSLWAKILQKKSLPKDHYNVYKSTTKFSFVNLNYLRLKNNHFDEKRISENIKKGKKSFFLSFKELINDGIIINKNQKVNSNGQLIGIPQGLPISAMLANIYMLNFDEAIVDNLVKKNDVFYRRYSDDIIMVCNKNQIDLVQNFVTSEITKSELIISKEKTERVLFSIEENRQVSFKLTHDNRLIKNIPLNYLGFEFYGYQTLIKSSNISKFYREMKYSIKRKSRRVDSIKENTLSDNAPVFKRKIYRLYSFKGAKTRNIPSKRGSTRKFRGNYLRYAYRAADELDAPEIKRQLRNHWRILQSTLKKYDFSNVKKE